MKEFNTINVNSKEPEIQYFSLEDTEDTEVGPDVKNLKLITEKKIFFLVEKEDVTKQDIAQLLKEESKYTNSELPLLDLNLEGLDRNTSVRRFMSRILAASNMVAVENRYGPATTIVIHPKTAKRFDIEGDYLFDLELSYNECINENTVYVLRKANIQNDFYEPGYYILKHEAHSLIARIGYFPQKTIQKIKIL